MGKKAKVIDEQGQELITMSEARRGRSLLASFGSRKEIDEMIDRILRSPMSVIYDPTMNASRKLTRAEALQIAMTSLSHGLDYFSGEIYGIINKQGVFAVRAGRDGWTKALAIALENEGGGHAWPIFRRVLNETEREELSQGAPAGAIIYVCELHDSRSHETFDNTVKAMSASGATWQDIKELAGKPYVVGVGWYAPSNNTQSQDKLYAPIERAKKRAYCAAIKLRAHLPFDVGDAAEDLPDEYTGEKLSDRRPAASETVVEQKTETKTETAEEREQRKSDARAVFGDDAEQVVEQTASETVVEQQATQVVETPLEVERKRYTALFNRASKLNLKPTPLSINDSAITLKGKGDTLEAQIKATEQF